jgi:ADP-heptose:LPS heptosyltransferase
LKQEGVGDTGRWITVNPFSRWSYKEWGLEKWAVVIDWLWKEFGLMTVIVGAKVEMDRAEKLRRLCRVDVFSLAGKTTLAELAGVLARSFFHLGVDSAAPHMGRQTGRIGRPSGWGIGSSCRSSTAFPVIGRAVKAVDGAAASRS